MVESVCLVRFRQQHNRFDSGFVGSKPVSNDQTVNAGQIRSTDGSTFPSRLGLPWCSILLISYTRQRLDNRKT
ncbi:hypothetical protein HanRHA438_Chr11g0485891 [Helianthus annuus]|nr:hypothetical protein HanHA300_Chr11g0387901 [Helianthus annuus]KAJ0507680.1 hypothetical protein HanIR_Chr11g0508881 [Helianthus annuus]KAJ0684146.1 hypothetical protein HanLR1_Chr11g0387991 [Helianthus annuus]KAJ0688100.1 hypothetical protein HanOQP8_Chr11g0390631 [Helianthus annuus]KAJ0869140.1 hypothetical protein HanRHA438_Chr11g0485891 [Helianthus annuus]